ncbi:MAG: conjugal transfer protein TrbL family protein, partial [Chloroflexota bacterium]
RRRRTKQRGVVRTIANAGLALVALVTGFNLMARQHLGAQSQEAMEVLSRLVLGALLVNSSLAWCQLLIDANNGLAQAIGQAGIPSWPSADGSSQLLATVIAILLYLVMSLLLLIQMFIRLALVDVLIVIAPIALLCWVLPQTQNWARLWSSTFTGAVMVQFVQVAALKLGGALMIDLGSSGADVKLLNLFLGVALLALTLKIPGLMRG